MFPLLYIFGWLAVQPLTIFFKNIDPNNLSLIGTLITFFSFVILLPSWVRLRWKSQSAWIYLGITSLIRGNSFYSFKKGLFEAFFVLLIILAPLFYGSWVIGIDGIRVTNILNALILGIGVGICEELVFRGWLLSEMNLLFGTRLGIFYQSLIFSLAHIRFNLNLFDSILLIVGLFLFGLLLALKRVLDQGSLWGCIGLHGGLVGTWFVIDSGLLRFAVDTPVLLIGPGGNSPNPIGGVVSITLLLIILFCQRKVFAKTGRFSLETVKASSKGASP